MTETTLGFASLAAALRERTDALGRAAAGGDPEARVPTCPDWPLRVLVGHMGQSVRWAAELVRKRDVMPPPDPWQAEPGPPRGWAAWLRAGAEELVAEVAEAGPDTEMRTFFGPRPTVALLRRMLNETCVHHYDAAATTGAAFAIPDDRAADVIDELLEALTDPGMAAFKPDLAELRGRGERIAVRPDGLDGWLVTRTPDGMRFRRGAGEADAVLAGTAADLMLVCARRLPLDEGRVRVSGDRPLIEHWVGRLAL
ncbi:maleylpyruvate isomerase family mycothiol-dependent enzyme [Actinomadura sp. ATCC 31491]|uniref:Maleylpyruvate isomerase family mycothiol-dependent enzyme n=1 Tax=Actinomadura luzonensis TaxID=2805427 RepID=A0ABT0G399_9ACTN|nr:maleylpyruvate isomerase family mycothiol-dependent enzyme [Actinomadura luzonensis]MCK2219081.1 maleylpyruvate isomerase family mycothiol-dependent enzyme [Actinomadura luzonensis]